jgi:sugar phosphate isomerase/epimerase
MKTKTLLLLPMFLGMSAPSIMAQSKSPVTIGVIQYDYTDLDKSFKELHDLGFGSCQFQYTPSKLTKDTAAKLKAAAKKNDIKVTTVVFVPGHCVWNFTQGPATIGLVPAEGREEKMKTYKEMIDFCVEAGVPAMHSHFGFIPEDPSSEQYKNFIQVMKVLAQYAKDKGIMIYFETGQETPTTLIRAIKDIGTGNLFINCDLANLLMYGKANSLDAVRQFGPLIKEIHAKDGKYPDRENPTKLGAEVPIPEGDVNFPAVIEELKKQNFSGAITIECELDGSNKDYVVKTRKYLQDLLDK